MEHLTQHVATGIINKTEVRDVLYTLNPSLNEQNVSELANLLLSLPDTTTIETVHLVILSYIDLIMIQRAMSAAPITLQPDLFAHFVVGRTDQDQQQRCSEFVAAELMKMKPRPYTHSNLLYCMHFVVAVFNINLKKSLRQPVTPDMMQNICVMDFSKIAPNVLRYVNEKTSITIESLRMFMFEQLMYFYFHTDRTKMQAYMVSKVVKRINSDMDNGEALRISVDFIHYSIMNPEETNFYAVLISRTRVYVLRKHAEGKKYVFLNAVRKLIRREITCQDVMKEIGVCLNVTEKEIMEVYCQFS